MNEFASQSGKQAFSHSIYRLDLTFLSVTTGLSLLVKGDLNSSFSEAKLARVVVESLCVVVVRLGLKSL